MAMMKYGAATVVNPVVSPSKWIDTRVAPGRMKIAKKVIGQHDIADWLLTHVTIMASVDCDFADPKDLKSNYLIKPEHSIFVNNNGDSWERSLLAATYKTFLTADNFVEHVQIPELSKGKILDVALREVPFAKDKDGKDITTLYVDILIATNRKHTDLIRKIESGEYSAVSMGCGLAGTPITMPDGTLRPIESIVEGDTVLTHTGSEKPVTALFEKEVEIPLYTVEYVGANEPLRLTGEHPILVAKKESVRCTKGKEVCHIGRESNRCYWDSKVKGKVHFKCGRDSSTHEYDMQFVPISEVSEGDYMARVYPLDSIPLKELDSKDLRRLLGIYTGDGYIGWQWYNKDTKSHKVKNYPAYIGFCLGGHEEDLIKEVTSILERVTKEGTKITHKEVPERNGHYINVYDKDLANLFFTHCGEGSHNKSFSKEVMFLPPEQQLDIISGMFDTDGCYYDKMKSLHYSSSSESLINQTHLMLLRNKIGNAREKVSRKGTGKKASVAKYFQETITVSKSYSYLVPSSKNKSYGIVPNNIQYNTFFYKNYYLSPITSKVRTMFSGMVYNFSVEDDESYAVNNAAVHNCLIKYSQCSQCGNIAEDETEACKHIKYYKGNHFFDKEGAKRVVAELCGRVEEPDSCVFIDASWVRKPAFEGAVLRNIVDIKNNSEIPVAENLQRALSAPSTSNEIQFSDSNLLLRAASSGIPKDIRMNSAKKAANILMGEIMAKDEDSGADEVDTKEDTAPEGVDAPIDDAPADDSGFPEDPGDSEIPAEDPGPSLGESLTDGTPEEPAIDEPAEDATAKEVRDMFKRQMLNELRRELMVEQAKTDIKNRPAGLENDINESLVHDASNSSRLKSALIKSASASDRLQNGLMILSNLKDWSKFKKYGYSREDVLGILYYVDSKTASEPLEPNMVKALSKVKLASSDLQSFFTEIIFETGHKPCKEAAQKMVSWAKILDRVER